MSVAFPITTREDAVAAYHANKLYALRGGNLLMCEAFIDACKFLLLAPLRMSEQFGAARMEFDPGITKEMLDQAEAWYAANYAGLSNIGASQRYADFTYYRD